MPMTTCDVCSWCGKHVYRNIKDQARSHSKTFYCSKSCQTKWRNSVLFVGSKHSNWVSGESSYRAALKRTDVLQICSKCSTDDKRVLAVHHRDRDRTNNVVTNLIWLCHNCHYLVHHYHSEMNGFIESKF